MDIQEALADTKNIGKQFRGILKVLEVLEDINNLSDAQATAKEVAETALQKTNTILETGKVKLDKLNSQLAEANLSIKEANNQAAIVINKANNQAGVTIKNAEKYSAEILGKAKQETCRMYDHMDSESKQHEKRMEEAETEYVVVADTVDHIKTELAELRRNIGLE